MTATTPRYPRRNPPGRPLRVGQIIQLLDGAHEVIRVSESGAVIRPVERRQVQVKTIAGKEIKFSAPRGSVSISTEAEVLILAPSKAEYVPV